MFQLPNIFSSVALFFFYRRLNFISYHKRVEINSKLIFSPFFVRIKIILTFVLLSFSFQLCFESSLIDKTFLLRQLSALLLCFVKKRQKKYVGKAPKEMTFIIKDKASFQFVARITKALE